MKNIIVGTAGHIDHGKTTLVKALTGIDTDRLKEEKARGISIDLGFANLRTAQGQRIAFIDVPGHERFVRNMLAGVSGIDIVLLVVAADEAIKPQTREHFEICRLLGLTRGVIALTKADLVDGDWLSLVRMEVEDFIRDTPFAGAPIVPVSATTGLGLVHLINEISSAAASLPQREANRYARLPIDRAFSMKGHGTVVTGTLKAGRLDVDTEIELYPSGRLARIRGIQVHGQPVRHAEAGERTAINLAGVEVGEILRGYVAAPPGLLSPVKIFDAKIQLLGDARAVKDRAKVHFHTGTMETTAELRVLDEKRSIAPGDTAFARIVLDTPTLLLPGDRFILRSFSPMVTIAGGEAVELHFGHTRLRRKGAPERLAALQAMGRADRIHHFVSEHPLGIDFAVLRQHLGCLPAEVPKDLDRTGQWVAATANLKSLAARIVDRLRAHHRDSPLDPGLSREALRTSLLPDAPAALLDVVLRYAPSVRAEGDLLRLESHCVRLEGKQDAASQKIEKSFLDAGLAVPAVDEVLQSSGVNPTQAKAILALLLRAAKLIRVGPDLVFHAEPLNQLRAQLKTRKGESFGVVEFKAWTGISRKYAIPLLEYLDREKVTVRKGDARLIL